MTVHSSPPPSPVQKVLAALPVQSVPLQREVLQLFNPSLRHAGAGPELIEAVWKGLQNLKAGFAVPRDLYARVAQLAQPLGIALSKSGLEVPEDPNREILIKGARVFAPRSTGIEDQLGLEKVLSDKLVLPENRRPRVVLVTNSKNERVEVLQALRLMDLLERPGDLTLYNTHPSLREGEACDQYLSTFHSTSFFPHTIDLKLGNERSWLATHQLNADLIIVLHSDVDPDHLYAFFVDNLSPGGLAVLQENQGDGILNTLVQSYSHRFSVVLQKNCPCLSHERLTQKYSPTSRAHTFCFQRAPYGTIAQGHEDESRIGRIMQRYKALYLDEAMKKLSGPEPSHKKTLEWINSLYQLFDLAYGMGRTDGFPLYSPEEAGQYLTLLMGTLIQVNEEKKAVDNLKKLGKFLTDHAFIVEAERAYLALRHTSGIKTSRGFVVSGMELQAAEKILVPAYANQHKDIPNSTSTHPDYPWKPTPGQEVLGRRIDPPENRVPLYQTVLLSLDRVVPCLYPSSREGLDEIRISMLLRLAALGWKKGEPLTKDHLWEILCRFLSPSGPELTPVISQGTAEGLHLLLDAEGHKTMAALITLVADQYLPEDTLRQELPWSLHATTTTTPISLLEGAMNPTIVDSWGPGAFAPFESFAYFFFSMAGAAPHLTERDLEISWHGLMRFHEPSAALLERLGPFAPLSSVVRGHLETIEDEFTDG